VASFKGNEKVVGGREENGDDCYLNLSPWYLKQKDSKEKRDPQTTKTKKQEKKNKVPRMSLA